MRLSALLVVVYLFIYFIIKRDRGHKEPRVHSGRIWLGILSIVLAMIFNGIFIPEEVGGTVNSQTQSTLPAPFFYGLSIGLIEETAKAIPLALFLYKNATLTS